MLLASQEHPCPVSCQSLPLPVSASAGQAVSLDTRCLLPARSWDVGQVRGAYIPRTCQGALTLAFLLQPESEPQSLFAVQQEGLLWLRGS